MSEVAGQSTANSEPSTSKTTANYHPPLHQEVSKQSRASLARSVSTKEVIISVKEKHGSFREAVPCMPLPFAVVCLIFNIFIPGSGTFLSAFSVFCCGFAEVKQCQAFGWNVLAAILQFLTIIFLVGWIWSIHWGIMFVTLSSEYDHERLSRKRHGTKVSSASPPV